VKHVGVETADVIEGDGLQAGDCAGGGMAVGKALEHKRGQSLFAQFFVVVAAQVLLMKSERVLTVAGEIPPWQSAGQDLLGQRSAKAGRLSR